MPIEFLIPALLIAGAFIVFMLVLAFGLAQAPGPGWNRPADKH